MGNNPYLLAGLLLAPRTYRFILRAVSPEDWDRRPNPDRFTVREAIAHVADWEPIMRQRMIDAVEHPGCAITAYDEGERAIQMRYDQTDAFAQLDVFAAERERTVQFLKSLAQDDWSKSAIHPERGMQTLDDQAALLLGHDHYHLEHLASFLPKRPLH